MATIVLDVPNISGSTELTGYETKLPALSIRDSLYTPLPTGTSNNTTVSVAQHSDINIVRYRDAGSPKLAAAASAATLFATVKIILFRQGTATVKYMEYELANVYLSRYECGTLDAEGLEFEPYMNPSDPMPPPAWGAAALLGKANMPQTVRQHPRPVRGGARGLPATANRELERLWFNAASVKWTYSLTGSSVSAGWNIVGGSNLAT